MENGKHPDILRLRTSEAAQDQSLEQKTVSSGWKWPVAGTPDGVRLVLLAHRSSMTGARGIVELFGMSGA
jgi:hypothetical protein